MSHLLCLFFRMNFLLSLIKNEVERQRVARSTHHLLENTPYLPQECKFKTTPTIAYIASDTDTLKTYVARGALFSTFSKCILFFFMKLKLFWK